MMSFHYLVREKHNSSKNFTNNGNFRLAQCFPKGRNGSKMVSLLHCVLNKYRERAENESDGFARVTRTVGIMRLVTEFKMIFFKTERNITCGNQSTAFLGESTACGFGKCICYTITAGLCMNCSSRDIRNVDEIINDIPSNVTKLDLSNNRISKLHNYSFRKASTLRELLLANNNISSAQKFTFKCLADVFSINISRNHLKYIPSFVPSSVEELDLSLNNITVIGNYSFSQYYQKDLKLKKLHLQNNNLEQIEELAFVGLSKLDFLNLSSNNIPFLSKYAVPVAFKPLQSLEVLCIQQNKVKTKSDIEYPDVILSDLKSLNSLTMDGIEKPFGPGFGKLTNLSSLILSGFHTSCFQNNLSKNTFKYLRSVKHLDLSACNLSFIEADAFSPLSELQTLDLSYNEGLSFNALQNVTYGLRNTNIKTLKYSYVFPSGILGTQLQRKDIRFLNETNLTSLYLDYNSLELFEFGILDYFPKTLKNLSLEGNKMMIGIYLKGLKNCRHLENVNLRNQYKSRHLGQLPWKRAQRRSISTTSSYCIDLTVNYPERLQTLYLDHSKLEYKLGCVKIPKNNRLEELGLAGNIFYSWQGPFKRFHNLKRLDLSRNYCSNISQTFFQYFSNLEQLIVQKNYIGLMLNDKTASIFQSLRNLKILDLSFNVITKVPKGLLDSLIHLEKLYLRANGLETFEVSLSRLDNIVYLDLARNSLGSLVKEVRSFLEKRMMIGNLTVDLSSNPISCTCENKDFIYWLSEHRNNFIGFKRYRFFDENNQLMEPGKFDTKVEEMKRKCKSYVIILILTSLSLFALVSSILGCVLYRYRWKLRYLYYMSKKKYRGYSAMHNPDTLDEFRYDAFISYAAEELRFIRSQLIPELEERRNLKLSIHQRDFIAGKAIAENIVEAISNSRKTVLIITRNFVKSWWCIYEFRMAQMETIYSRAGRSVLIAVIMEAVPSNHIPIDLLRLFQSQTYFEYPSDQNDSQLFWNQVKEAIEQ